MGDTGYQEEEMNKIVSVGIIGDYNGNLISHPATNSAIEHAAESLDVKVSYKWIPTLSLLTEADLWELERFDGLWVSAGSPYLSMEGALNGIRYGREKNKPLFGT